ncbi:hypothetical protein T08_62 [Trichinella sp. T8]|nr:hypothetical protein T08_62 [Trichinella sp. T8]
MKTLIEMESNENANSAMELQHCMKNFSNLATVNLYLAVLLL